MLDYRYTLIRYVPDAERMEPVNVGVILQGQGTIKYRFNPHIAKRKDVNTDAFRQWKQFFLEEIDGHAIPLFQPDRNSPHFLQYLETLCEGPVLLSRPLAISAPEYRGFEDVMDGLYTRLVQVRDIEPSTEAARPTGRFRRFTEEYRFLQRGMKSYSPVQVPNHGHWTAYRKVVNGKFIAIDKVEVGRELGRTATEIDRLPRVLELLAKFMAVQIEGKQTRYVLLADDLSQPFADQPAEEFQSMQEDIDRLSKRIESEGGEVLRTSQQVTAFAEDLNGELPTAA